MNIFVGNLSYNTTEQSLQTLFAAHGTVSSVKIVIDRETGRSRGFAFVEMANDSEGAVAMKAIDGSSLDGRALKVNEARPREPALRWWWWLP
jgi:RNA recognition motif-containing protein